MCRRQVYRFALMDFEWVRRVFFPRLLYADSLSFSFLLPGLLLLWNTKPLLSLS